MTDLSILKELFNEKALLPVEKDKYGKKLNVILTELASDYSVEITGVPEDLFVVKVDLFKAPNNVFQGNKGENKRADYLLISPERRCIIYIELKRKDDKPEIIMDQLKGAFCFCKYVQAIGKEFWKNTKFLEDYKHRFICMGNMSAKETKITKPPTGTHDTPEMALKITGAGCRPLHFNKLVGNRQR